MEDFLNMKLNANSSGSLELWLYQSKGAPINQKLSFKNKIRYKIWRHLNNKLKKKGII